MTSWVIDPAIVSCYDSNLPLGYETDHLVVARINRISQNSPQFQPLNDDQEWEAIRSLKSKLKDLPEVTDVTYTYIDQYIGSAYLTYPQFGIIGKEETTPPQSCTSTFFFPNSDFFETYGFKSVPGSPSIEELSNMTLNANQYIITRDVAEYFWPGENAVGKEFSYESNNNTYYQQVVGVVENIRYSTYNRSYWHSFTSPWFWRTLENCDMIIRLRPDVDAKDFCTYLDDNNGDFTAGNYYLDYSITQNEALENVEKGWGITSTRNTNIALALFFLVNLILGVSGSFFLQARRRVVEMGIHRSFGATKEKIIALIMGEATVLATIAFIIGELVFLQIALYKGLTQGSPYNLTGITMDSWVTSFPLHFLIVAGIVYIVIIISTLIGSYFPASKVSRINPVDALRNE